MDLTPVMEKFILHWGEMGSTWGVNRTVAQIHALLYLSPKPLTAEEISETLSIARSTVSTGLRELQSWDIIKAVHVLGDRRDHFEAETDVWEMFRAILTERKHREIDPTVEFLQESMAQVDEHGAEDPYMEERLQALLDFYETVTTLYAQLEHVPSEVLAEVAELGDKLGKVLGMVVRG
jgi:DNA-binding transcriptional regulator GbsR (MarR family)